MRLNSETHEAIGPIAAPIVARCAGRLSAEQWHRRWLALADLRVAVERPALAVGSAAIARLRRAHAYAAATVATIAQAAGTLTIPEAIRSIGQKTAFDRAARVRLRGGVATVRAVERGEVLRARLDVRDRCDDAPESTRGNALVPYLARARLDVVVSRTIKEGPAPREIATARDREIEAGVGERARARRGVGCKRHRCTAPPACGCG